MFYHQQTNCTFIDYDEVIDKAFKYAIDDLLNLGMVLIEEICVNFKDNDVKNIFRHHIIHQTCEAVLNCKMTGYKVLYISRPEISFTTYIDTVATYDIKCLNKFISKLYKDMVKYLPIIFYNTPHISYKKFYELMIGPLVGESLQELNMVLNVVNTFDSTSYRFDELRKYSKKHKLSFLSEEYFNGIYTKKLLYCR